MDLEVKERQMQIPRLCLCEGLRLCRAYSAPGSRFTGNLALRICDPDARLSCYSPLGLRVLSMLARPNALQHLTVRNTKATLPMLSSLSIPP